MSASKFNKIKPTGIILAGGKSLRMGEDKALLKLGRISFLETIYNTLKPLCSDIIISTNNPKLHINTGITVRDKHSNIGPIGGIYSCLSESKTEENFIISVDTPFINKGLLQYIYKNSYNNSVTVCKYKSKIHPLIGVYKKSFIKILEEDIKNTKHKTIAAIYKTNYSILDITSDLSFYKPNLFLNINEPSDLSDLNILL